MTNTQLTKYIDEAIERHLRDQDHERRKSLGLTPWPNSTEQNLIDQFNIFQPERENEQW